jgi:beta-carotene hydroxylase
MENHRRNPADQKNIPALKEIAPDLTHISRCRRTLSLILPFLYAALYFCFAALKCWPLAVLALMCLSFVTYGSTSHDLVHRNLGLRKSTNDLLLSLIELLALRSGHAYRLAHLHHHARYPQGDDIEGAAARMSLMRTLLEGLIFQFKIWLWAVRRDGSERAWVISEGVSCVLLVALALVLYPFTQVFTVYVVLMIMGSWIIPLITSYIPHDPDGRDMLTQTRLFRGRVASIIALEHLYHLEHHLYPAVPHHNWPKLAKRLDTFFEASGVKPFKIRF